MVVYVNYTTIKESTVDLHKYLRSDKYPATKRDVVKKAKDYCAPQEVVVLLHGLTDKNESVTDKTCDSHLNMK